MNMRQLIQQINKDNDPQKISALVRCVMTGGLKLNLRPVQFSYFDAKEFFQRCDPSIDDARFEEMCQMADAV